jgi:hypothetical protein
VGKRNKKPYLTEVSAAAFSRHPLTLKTNVHGEGAEVPVRLVQVELCRAQIAAERVELLDDGGRAAHDLSAACLKRRFRADSWRGRRRRNESRALRRLSTWTPLNAVVILLV